MSRASTMIENAAWVWKSKEKIERVRKLMRQEMEPTDQQWPIWIHGTVVGFPGDDAVAPIARPTNDVTFTITR